MVAQSSVRRIASARDLRARQARVRCAGGALLKNELRDWARERLLDNAQLSEWFRQAEVERLLDDHDRGRFNHGKKLWALLMFAVWSKKYLAQ
jgi:hypothetical protein